ncbi:hypothetical protein Droror1_Dr00024860 [Drosera rotundifolia]
MFWYPCFFTKGSEKVASKFFTMKAPQFQSFSSYLAAMDPSPHPLHFLLLSFFILLSIAFPTIDAVKLSHRSNTLLLPVSKHASTHQYIASIRRNASPVPTNVVLDLNGKYLWVSHDSSYNFSHKLPRSFNKCCNRCSAWNNRRNIKSHPCGKHRSRIVVRNTFSGRVSVGNLTKDVISMQSTDGLNPGFFISAPFLFFSAPVTLTHGLASHSKGVAGLGQTTLALPTQFSRSFNLSRKFGVCLPPSSDTMGVIFFGNGPYDLLPGIDISKILIHTPLMKHPRHQEQYFIGTRSIMVNSKRVTLRPSLLNMNRRGMKVINTKISITTPYSILETSIYKSLTRLFIDESIATNVTRVTPISPFGLCFSTKKCDDKVPCRVAMPVIDLVMQSDVVFWRIFETNSMIKMREDVSCLGFLDGGVSKGAASIVIGANLLEDNLLQFDLELNRLGFSSSLLLSQTSCANFNFTSSV